MRRHTMTDESGAVVVVYVDREILAVAFESVCHVWSAEQFVGEKRHVAAC